MSFDKIFDLTAVVYFIFMLCTLTAGVYFHFYNMYKRSGPRAAAAARYARARKISTKYEGGREKRPMILCNLQFDNAKSYLWLADCPVCAVLFVGDVTF